MKESSPTHSVFGEGKKSGGNDDVACKKWGKTSGTHPSA